MKNYCCVCKAMFEGVEGAACPNCDREIDKMCESLLFHEDGHLVQSEQPVFFELDPCGPAVWGRTPVTTVRCGLTQRSSP